MGFHYGYEKRKFDAEWTRLEQEYRAAGMDDRQIAAMKEYDWSWFCSQRTYQNRVQALPSGPIRTAYRPFPADLSEPRTGPSQRTV